MRFFRNFFRKKKCSVCGSQLIENSCEKCEKIRYDNLREPCSICGRYKHPDKKCTNCNQVFEPEENEAQLIDMFIEKFEEEKIKKLEKEKLNQKKSKYYHNNISVNHTKSYEKWNSNDIDELKKLFFEKSSVSEIAKKLCRTEGAIRDKIRHLNLKNLSVEQEKQKIIEKDASYYLLKFNYKTCGPYYPRSKLKDIHDKHELSRDIIKNKKYFTDSVAESAATNRIAKQMINVLTDSEYKNYDLIIPVPNHPSTSPKNSRAVSISHELSNLVGKPCIDDALEKLMDIPNHKFMNATQRKSFYAENRVFKLHKPELIHGKKILLIDDVITTSGTVIECIKELSHGSPDEIFVLCAGKTTLVNKYE